MSDPATVLVVDDEERNLMVMTDVLEAEGYRVITAKDGREGLERIANDMPHVVLLDINMPHMDGLEVTRRVKSTEALWHVPIIIITAVDDIQSRLDALNYGADDFMTKPPHNAELRARVGNLVKVRAYYDHLKTYQMKLESEVKERTRQLRQALTELEDAHSRLQAGSLDTILRLSRAAEYKDEDTSAHISRVSEYVAAIATEVGLDEDEVETLRHASPMHDIGKIGVPDRILLKPGKLTPDEWKTMKMHTVFGHSILDGSRSKVLESGRTIALTHHEKWDGRGYPRGLAGDQIPLSGRITAVADVFDALTSRRPYKEPFPLDESLRIIRNGAGRDFDPHIVDAFFRIQDDLLRIRRHYEDDGPSVLAKLNDGLFDLQER